MHAPSGDVCTAAITSTVPPQVPYGAVDAKAALVVQVNQRVSE